MDDLTRLRLRAMLERDEGRRNRMYLDSVGAWTIGVGHNLRDRGISDAAIDQILDDDITDTERELVAALPWITTLDPVRYAVVMAMAFNLGVVGLLGFKHMLAYVQAGEWEKAADAMRDSEWAKQVGARETRLERLMLSGQW